MFIRRQTAFTLLELLVVIGLIGLLLAILLPAAEHVRHQAYIEKCASNLHQIGVAIAVYEQENAGDFPRTIYDPAAPLAAGTNANSADPFQPGGPATNDLTSGIFLLMKVEKLPAQIFICPYNDDTEYIADPVPPQGRSNFTSYKKNLAFSFANAYPNAAATSAGYRLTSKIAPDFVLAADMNPGVSTISNVYLATPTSSKSDLQKCNSENHEREGQNALFGDLHVSWNTTPCCGIGHDNIYTSRIGIAPTVKASPADAADSVLLPEE